MALARLTNPVDIDWDKLWYLVHEDFINRDKIRADLEAQEQYDEDNWPIK